MKIRSVLPAFVGLALMVYAYLVFSFQLPSIFWIATIQEALIAGFFLGALGFMLIPFGLRGLFVALHDRQRKLGPFEDRWQSNDG